VDNLTIDINGKCNIGCKFCYQNLDGSLLSKKEVLKIVDQNASSEIIEIGGGEPFLHKELSDIVEGIVARGKRVHISTNATFIPQNILEMEEDVRRNVIMQVSLHASDRERYIAITGKDFFDKVIENAKRLRDLYTTVLSAAIYKENFDQVETILQIGYKLGIPTRINLVMPVGNGRNVELLSPQEVNLLTGILLVEKIAHPSLVESPLLHQLNCPALCKAYGLKKTGTCPLEVGLKEYVSPRGEQLGCEFLPAEATN